MTERDFPPPEEPTVTLPLSQVAGWLEQLMALEEQVAASASATGTAALAAELIREDGTPSAEFAKASLSGVVNAYNGILLAKFSDHDQENSLAKKPSKTLPRAPEYKSTERWERHIAKYGVKTSWQEDAQHGVHEFETTHLPHGTFNELVGFRIGTATKYKHESVIFTFSNGAITRVTHTQDIPRRWPRDTVRNTKFVLELEPELLVRQPIQIIGEEIMVALRFDRKKGEFSGDYITVRKLDAVHSQLATILNLVPEDYRPDPSTR